MTNPLDRVTTIKGYHIMTGIQIRTINRMIKRGELTAKYDNGVWLILIPDQLPAQSDHCDASPT